MTLSAGFFPSLSIEHCLNIFPYHSSWNTILLLEHNSYLEYFFYITLLISWYTLVCLISVFTQKKVPYEKVFVVVVVFILVSALYTATKIKTSILKWYDIFILEINWKKSALYFSNCKTCKISKMNSLVNTRNTLLMLLHAKYCNFKMIVKNSNKYVFSKVHIFDI